MSILTTFISADTSEGKLIKDVKELCNSRNMIGLNIIHKEIHLSHRTNDDDSRFKVY